MQDVVIVDAVRTPVGRYLGNLSRWSATELGAFVVRGLLERNSIDGAGIDEVIFGNVVSAGLGQAPARQAAINGCVAASVPAVTVNKVCGASLRSVVSAVQAIRCADGDCLIAGGMESLSNAPHLLRNTRRGVKAGGQTLVDAMIHDGLWCAFEDHHMGFAAEYTAKKSGITRKMQDEFALHSHQKAAAATDVGAFANEIVPVGEDNQLITEDETFRRDTTLEKLSNLKPVFTSDGTVTAGNAPGLNDGASALLVMDANIAKGQGKKPLARIAGYATAATEPIDLFYAPVHSTEKLLHQLNMKISDIDLIEINEAFAAQTLADGDLLKWNWDRVNVHGGAIALGHPLGASGTRLLTTLVWALKRHDKEWGLVTICMGGGLGLSLAIQRVT
jgi:acetyl-CoA C-acetyltransferase